MTQSKEEAGSVMALTREEEKYVIKKAAEYSSRGARRFCVPVLDNVDFTTKTAIYSDASSTRSFRSASVCLETIRLGKGPMESPPIDAIRIDGVIVWDEIRGHIQAEDRE